MFRPMKITFHLDGTGVYYDPYEPIMLDGLLAAAVCRWHVHGEPPARDEAPDEIPLPLARWNIGEHWGWRASALFPEGDISESMQHWRKRFRQNHVELTVGSPNLSQGVYRDWNMPFTLQLAAKMIAYAVGDIRVVKHELKRCIKYLGKKRAHGRGAVTHIDAEEVREDFSISMDGRLMRWMPSETGSKLVRPRPPYWSTVGRTLCNEIGQKKEGHYGW